MADPNAPVVIASCRHELEAGMLVNELRQHGVYARSVGESVSGLRAEAPGEISILVAAAEETVARQIIAQLKNASNDLDWSQVDVGNPIE